MKEKDMDTMLDVCFSASHELVKYLESHGEELAEFDAWSDGEEVNRTFHTLGACVANYVLSFTESGAKNTRVASAFLDGYTGFLDSCAKSKKSNSEDPLRLILWVAKENGYRH